MKLESKSKVSAGYLLAAVFFLLLIAVVGCSSDGGGSSASFNTNDNSIDEWASVPVFQTDPAGDVPVPDEDILEIKVANSPADGSASDIYFLMKVAGNPALQGQYKGAVASLDCDGNGVDQEPHDRFIAFVPSEDQFYVMRGDQSLFFSGGNKDGQVVGDYVEWKISVDDLPPDDKDDVQCSGNVKLRFATADLSEYYSAAGQEAGVSAVLIDETSPLMDWNLP